MTFVSKTASDRPNSGEHQPRAGAAKRALVIGGGGSSGNAWVIGVIAGLFESGLDVTSADLIIGTSSGATTAVQIASTIPTELLAATLAAVPQQRSSSKKPVADHLTRTNAIIAGAEDAADMRRSMGAAAIEMAAAEDSSRQSQWRATVAARLPTQCWPLRTVLITAVDAHTGEPAVFDCQSRVDLADAVAASCSSGAAYAIGINQYIDGGYRRNENADLAAGYERVLVLSPFGGKTRMPLAWGMQLAAQVDELRACGSSVETIFPESSTEHLFGANAMDQSLRAPAARAGYHQGNTLAGQLTDFWG